LSTSLETLPAKTVMCGERIIKGKVAPEASIDDGPLFIGEGAVIEPGAYVQTPAYIGQGAILRQGACLRSNVIMLTESLLGHVSEAKNAVFLPRARAPHFAYVGDSVLGHAVNLGAGVKLSNLPIVAADAVKLAIDGEVINTGLRKFGAILGDGVQIGCNTVLNPLPPNPDARRRKKTNSILRKEGLDKAPPLQG
jgi:NDP-sugar pyrophosphorylase family protein